ncbi:ATP-binding protein [Planomonospora sp. ID82291]|uniref:sensor histidine kinase n=1 Tax=Planomonospora sp. ID82291 TaxID=2738136 RepID=UPI0018C35A1C|nr:ATP-binding protein [Planomonospora sp. ID82291]MBG0818546.1 CHASE domain-containing protein [Planomonospora sp. ID82291]
MSLPVVRRLRRPGRTGGLVPACLLLVIGLAVSLLMAGTLADTRRRQAEERMDRHLEAARLAVTGEVYRRAEILGHLAASVGAQQDLTAQDFEALTFRLAFRGMPGITDVGYVVSVPDAQVQAVQRAWRRKGSANLSLRPVGAAEHRFVVLDRSLDTVSPALGSDLMAAAEPAEALDAARAGGQVTASRAYVLLRDRMLPAARQQTSFLLVAPVYGAGDAPDAGLLRGWLVMGVRGGDFIDGTLRQVSQGLVGVTLSDASVPGGERRIAAVRAGEPLADARLHREVTVDVAGRTWRLRVVPAAGFASAADARLHLVVLAGGVVISVLLAGLVVVLGTSRARALAHVEQATATLKADIARRRRVEARLRERETELERFAAVAAHDLKSPLTVIAGYSELVEDQLAESAGAQVSGWLQRIRGGTGRMQRLIDDLLAYAAAGDASLEPAEVDLERLVADIVMDRTAHLRHDRPNVEIGRLPVVTADPVRLRQVMDNLIGNAVKYVRHGTVAQIDVSAERDGPMWRVTVADRGIGIAPDQRDAVFTAFGRARGSEGYPGTGLGLAICRRIVGHHGGEIHAEENAGGGTRFVFTLPVVPGLPGRDALAEDGAGGDPGDGSGGDHGGDPGGGPMYSAPGPDRR